MPEATGLKTIFILGATTIAQVAGISPPGPTRDVIEVEDLNPTDEVKKKLLGLIDVGECTLTLNFDPANAGHQTLEAALYSGVLQTCKIKYPGGSGYTFSGYVTGFAPQEIGPSDVMQAEVTITVTTKPTYGVIS
jgi:hypothetical protein